MADGNGTKTGEAPAGPNSMAAAMVEDDDAKADELVKSELAAVASGEKVATGEGAEGAGDIVTQDELKAPETFSQHPRGRARGGSGSISVRSRRARAGQRGRG